MIANKNVMLEYISNGALAADLNVAGEHVSTLGVNEIAFIDLEGNALANEAAVAAVGKFKVAVGYPNGVIRVSDEIIYDNATFKRGAYAAAVEQITYVGYNGTSGSIDAINSNTYMINLWMRTELAMLKPNELKQGFYTSDASANQMEIATGLRVSLVNNFKREVEKRIQFDLLSAHAGGAIGAAADTVVGTKGTKYVVVTDTGGDTSVNAIVAGDYFRAGTATTSPVYKVVASTVGTGGGTLTLDVPLNADVNLVGTTSEFISAANAAASAAGIKLTGVALSFEEGVRKYEKSTWDTQLVDCGNTTLVDKSTAANKGVGTYEQVAEIEWFTQNFEKESTRLGVPPFKPRKVATSGNTYNLYTISWYSTGTQSTISADPKSYKQVIIAALTGNLGGAIDGFWTSM